MKTMHVRKVNDIHHRAPRALLGALCTAMLGGTLSLAGWGVASATSLPVPLPIVATTAPVTVGSSTSVTLTGTVNPNGLDTAYYFEYGLEDGGFSFPTGVTAVADAGSGTTAVPVSATLTGLTPNALYEVEIAASNSAGNSYGDMLAFDTNGPVSLTLGVTGLSSNTATLNGSVNPNGTDTSYYFEVGTTSSYGINTATADAGTGVLVFPVSGSLTLSGLTAGTTYNYQLVSTNAFGTTYGGNATFTTTGTAPTQFTGGQIVTSAAVSLRKPSVAFGKETQERLNVHISALTNVTPSGQVTMMAGAKALCSIAISSNAGSCVLSSKKLGVGTYRITASYAGTSTFLASTSSPVTLRIVK